jgi:hypothetical protein
MYSPPSRWDQNAKCSTRNERQPTVSASSSVSFHRRHEEPSDQPGIANCFVSLSLDLRSLPYDLRVFSIFLQAGLPSGAWIDPIYQLRRELLHVLGLVIDILLQVALSLGS